MDLRARLSRKCRARLRESTRVEPCRPPGRLASTLSEPNYTRMILTYNIIRVKLVALLETRGGPALKAEKPTRCTAFAGPRLVVSGDLPTVALAAKDAKERGDEGRIRVFDDATGRRVDVDLRGTREEVAARYRTEPPDDTAGEGPRRGRGRPKLGVVAREVTLLPRHWAWLSAQRGSVSAVLRRLVDEARRTQAGPDRIRRSQDRTYRFLSATVGNEPGFEEAVRALYAGNRDRFEAESEGWPPDLLAHGRRLAAEAFPERES
jgi:hypothetical protein